MIAKIQRKFIDDRIFNGFADDVNCAVAHFVKASSTVSPDVLGEQQELETEIRNLVAFVGSGDSSSSIRNRLTECGRRLEGIKRQSAASTVTAIPPAGLDTHAIRNRLAGFKDLFSRYESQTVTTRRELANMFENKLSSHPTKTAKTPIS